MAGGDVFSPLPNGRALAAPHGTAPAEVATPGSPRDAAFAPQAVLTSTVITRPGMASI